MKFNSYLCLVLFGCSFVVFSSAQTLYVPSGSVGTSSNGNVGVGSSSPAGRFEVYTTSYQDAISAIGNDPANARVAIRNVNGYDYALISGITAVSNGGFSIRDLTHSIDLLVASSVGNVGIGTASPTSGLDVATAWPQLILGGTSNQSGAMRFRRNDGVITGRIGWLASTDGNTFEIAETSGAANLKLSAEPANSYITLNTGGNERLRVDSGGNVGIGTTNPTQKLAVNGTIRAKEVIVDTAWSDYVFEENYKLKALSEVEAFVKAEKHLPEIPSAQEVAEHGVSMGEMQSKMLAKIEELTLYMIELKKENTALRKEMHALKYTVTNEIPTP